MASLTNKRQQARHERTLQDLIKGIPGNNKCADCGANNPGWASWNLGIFLCMRCASLHRKLGTHISKVKSLSMDTWTAEQVHVRDDRSGRHIVRPFNKFDYSQCKVMAMLPRTKSTIRVISDLQFLLIRTRWISRWRSTFVKNIKDGHWPTWHQ